MQDRGPEHDTQLRQAVEETREVKREAEVVREDARSELAEWRKFLREFTRTRLTVEQLYGVDRE